MEGSWGSSYRKAIVLIFIIILLFLIGNFAIPVLVTLSSSSDRPFQKEFELYQSQYSATTLRGPADMEQRKNILVTGGAGYIGVHTIITLLESGYDITVVDNLINSSTEGLKRVIEITKSDQPRIRFYQVDLLDSHGLEEVFQNSPTFNAAIHFAGLKAVGESVHKPLLYYENNIQGTINLLNLMGKYGCNSFIFSSSATVYGAGKVPITENSPVGLGITNAYGRTKYMIEEILKDFKLSKDLEHSSTEPLSVVILRYFNPVGSHPSGLVGEDPNGIPNNLMPFVSQVAIGRRPKLTIFGNDYETKDGTGVRDYIHVMDLAEGHVAALRYIEGGPSKGVGTNTKKSGHGKLSIFNLGTGRGYSVLEMIEAMKKASGRPLPYEFAPRRSGDVAVSYADPSLARSELGWSAHRGLNEMCRDLWNWQSQNPNGYTKAKEGKNTGP